MIFFQKPFKHTNKMLFGTKGVIEIFTEKKSILENNHIATANVDTQHADVDTGI